ncbi:MAG: HEAT repeat domain-containing protein [Planctomycetaceae bacterium]|nr:HEAT repeat domain-containing protein [Planctomycetaceae bacterium]
MSDTSDYPQPPDPLAGREDEFGVMPAEEMRDLPQVEPPSAGFIVQLFLVPALIVTVVIGVYLLFGKLASSEQDWRKQLSDVRHDNAHIRWRGALGLAQMLEANATADGVPLSENRDVASELTQLMRDALAHGTSSEDDYKQQEFLARTLGLIDVPDVTMPVLLDAMAPSEDRDVRKNAIAAVATTANRFHEQGKTFDTTEVVPAIISASEETDSVIRHLSTFTLGLFDSPDARDRLAVLLEHEDRLTRENAAIALARQGSLDGLPVFESVLQDAVDRMADPPASTKAEGDSEIDAAQFEGTVALQNTIRALSELSGELDATQRSRITELLTPIAEDHADTATRVEAKSLLNQLSDPA